MTCKKCGAELKDGALVCESCGAAVTGAELPVSEKPAANAGKADGKPEKNKKRSYKPAIIAAVAALALLAGGFFGIRALMNRTSGDNSYVYLSGDSLNIISDPVKGTSFEFDKLGSGTSYTTPAVQFSPDGEYMYYLADFNDETNSGTLKMAEWKKLSDSAMSNSGHITKIDTDVLSDFEVTDSGRLMYSKSDYSLHTYDGGKSTKIADNVYDYYPDDGDRIVYTKSTDSGLSIYCADLSAPDKAELLADSVSYIYSADDPDNIVYSANDDGTGETIHVSGFNGEAMSLKIGEENTLVDVTDKALYYMNADDSAVLYEFIKDVDSERDENIRPPIKSDFAEPGSMRYVNMTKDDKITEHERIYITITNPSKFFEGGFETMEKAAELDNTDGFIVREFVDKYKSLENEDGYIPFSDEIRDGLVAISQAMGTGAPKEWLEMCFYKEPVGEVTYDEEAYNAAQEDYYNASTRNIVRTDLMNEINAVPLYKLMRYDFEKKESEVMVDEILYASAFSHSLMYKTRDSELESVDINELTAYWDAYSYLTLDYSEENMLFSFTNDKAYTVEKAAAAVLDSEDLRADFDLIFSGDGLLLNAAGGVYNAEISDTEITGFDLVADDGYVLDVDGDVIYFGSTYNTRGSLEFMNLNTMVNGEIKCLAKDIMSDTVNVYEDGVVIANTNYTSGVGYQLSVFDRDGNAKIVTDAVDSYLRVDENTILCITAGDLYVCSGSEKVKVASGVDSVWSGNYMKVKKNISGYNGYNYGGM
ncbi:MAG: zinc ribbon domain-containing protein [Oscillospiraceae bacterium]|nr:zinc ribbon domain-containing protein [Oscillospiraceae bacterium]